MNTLKTRRRSVLARVASGVFALGLVCSSAMWADESSDATAPTSPSPTPRAEAAPQPGFFPPGTRHGTDQLFSVALVAAEAEPAASAPLPAGLQKAIDDVRSFLPYKSYRLVDAGLVRTNSHGTVALNGPGDVRWQVVFEVITGSEPGMLIDNFILQGTGPVHAGVAGTHGSLKGSFRIQRGETVVVGSAALADSSKAIIALFSAVP